MQVGKTKDQGLYNKPSAAVHPGALAAGTLPQYNTIHLRSRRLTYDGSTQIFKPCVVILDLLARILYSFS